MKWTRALLVSTALAMVIAGVFLLPVAEWTIRLAERARGAGAVG